MQAEWSRWYRWLNSLSMIDSCIWDKLADKIDETLSEVGDAGSWIHYWWSLTTFVICWLIKLMMYWLCAAAFCFLYLAFCSVCNVAVFMKFTVWSFLDLIVQTVTIPKLYGHGAFWELFLKSVFGHGMVGFQCCVRELAWHIRVGMWSMQS